MNPFDQVYEDFRWISNLVQNVSIQGKPFKHDDVILLRKKMEEKESAFVAEVDGCNPTKESYKKIFDVQTINFIIPMEKLQRHLQEIYDSLVREASFKRDTFRELFSSFDNAGGIVFVDCSESSTYVNRLFPKLDEYSANYAKVVERIDTEGVKIFRSFALKRARATEAEKTKNHILNCIQCVTNIQTYINVMVSLEQIRDKLNALAKKPSDSENTLVPEDTLDEQIPQLPAGKADGLEEMPDEIEYMDFPLQF